MKVIITFTCRPVFIDGHEYNYTSDGLFIDHITGEVNVYYSGQNQGRDDHQLLTGIENQASFEVYFRDNSSTPFIYAGNTTISSVVRPRIIETGKDTSTHERLCIKLSIHKFINLPLSTTGKQAVFQHAGLDLSKPRNIQVGFYILD